MFMKFDLFFQYRITPIHIKYIAQIVKLPLSLGLAVLIVQNTYFLDIKDE